MQHPYPILTGAEILRTVSRNAVRRLLCNILLLMIAAGFFTLLTIGILRDFQHGFVLLFTVPIWILCFYFPAKKLRTQRRVMRDAPNAAVFRRFGSPDEIAAVLTDPLNVQVLSSKKILLTRAYLMLRDDFLTFLPLGEIAAISVTGVQGGGRFGSRHIYLTVIEKTGAKSILRMEAPSLFRSLKTEQQQIFDTIRAHMAHYAPDCCVS